MKNKEKIIIEMLLAGHTVKEVAKVVNMEPKNLYPLIKKHNLPKNSDILSGGAKERKIMKLYEKGFSFKDLGLFYSQTPENIKKILNIK